MTERWKDISGYEGRYQVSDTGRVYPSIAQAAKACRVAHRTVRKEWCRA